MAASSTSSLSLTTTLKYGGSVSAVNADNGDDGVDGAEVRVTPPNTNDSSNQSQLQPPPLPPNADDSHFQSEFSIETSSTQPSPALPVTKSANDLTQSKVRTEVACAVPWQSSSSSSSLLLDSSPRTVQIENFLGKTTTTISNNNSSSAPNISSKSYKSQHSPGPNFPQMVFSFLPLSSAMETTLKATNFAATAFSKALSSSTSAVNSISTLESSTALSANVDHQTTAAGVPPGPSTSAPLPTTTSAIPQSQSSSSSALPYVHLPGVLTALDQAVQEYDVLLSENGAVAFMRPNFNDELFSDDARLVEVKVLSKEALLLLASSPPLGYLKLTEALKVGSPVPMRQLKASSLGRLLNSVEAIFTRASDLLEATSVAAVVATTSSSSSDDNVEDKKEEKEEKDVAQVETDTLFSPYSSGEKQRTSSSTSTVISLADDALTSLLLNQGGNNCGGTVTAVASDVGEKKEEKSNEDNNEDYMTNSGEQCDDDEQDNTIKETAAPFDRNSCPTELPLPNSTDSPILETTTSDEVDKDNKVKEVAKSESGDENDDDEKLKIKEKEEGKKELCLPTVVLQPPTPQPPPLVKDAPRRDSFLHGPRSKRYAHLTGIELLSMPAREKSASTPSLMSTASSEISANSNHSSNTNSGNGSDSGGSGGSNRNSFHSIKTSSSSFSLSSFLATGKLDTATSTAAAAVPVIMLPGDDFEDLKVDTENAEIDEDKLFGSNSSKSSSTLLLKSAVTSETNGAAGGDHISAESSGSSSSGPSSLASEELKNSGQTQQQQQQSTSASMAATTTSNTATATVSGGGHKRRPSTLIQIHNPTYKARCEDFEAIFGAHGIPPTEQLMADFSCAYYKSILIQGRVYITQHYFAFYANWVGLYEKYMIIKCADVRSMVKANTMMWIPNAIHITTVDGEKHIFASFGARDRAYEVMSTVWKAVKEAEKEERKEEGKEEVGKLMENNEGEKGGHQVELNGMATENAGKENQQNAVTIAEISEMANQKVDDNGNALSSNVIASSTTISTSTTSTITITAKLPTANASLTTLKKAESSSRLSDEERWSIVKTIYGDNLGFSQQEEIELFGLKKQSETVELLAAERSDDEQKMPSTSSSLLTVENGSSEEDVKADKKRDNKKVAVKQHNSVTASTSLSTAANTSSASNSPKTAHFTKRERSPHKGSKTSTTPNHQRKKSLSNLASSITSSSSSTSSTKPQPPSTPKTAVKCPCTDAHYGTIVLERTYPVPVDVLYELFFAEPTPSAPKSTLFVEQFLRSRGTTDLKMTPWEAFGEEAELAELAKSCKDLGTYADVRATFGAVSSSSSSESSAESSLDSSQESLGGGTGVKRRLLEYTVQLNHVMCKSCYTRERQYLLAARPGAYYVVLSEAKNEGPPFSDCFVVCSTLCLSAAAGDGDGSGHTKVTLQYKLCWVKTSLSMRMLTGTIERSSKEGFTEVALAKMRRAEMHLRLLPPDEHFLGSLPVEVAAELRSSSAQQSQLQVENGQGTVAAAAASSAGSLQKTDNNFSAGTVQSSTLSSISGPVSAAINNSQVGGTVALAKNSIYDAAISSSLSIAGPHQQHQRSSAGCTNSAHSLLPSVNLLLAILVLFVIAYIVLIYRVWSMEERMDRMADYIMAVLKDNAANANGGGSGNDGSSGGSASSAQSEL